MPIFVNDYTWRQTESNIIISVSLRGVPYSQADIFTSEKYIKANYHPFMFEIFLLNSINTSKSKCTALEGKIIFDLVKNENTWWETINDEKISKKEAISIKQKIIEETQNRLQQEHKEKLDKKAERGREAVREQMSIDDFRHKQIETIRNSEIDIAMNQFESLRKKMMKPNKYVPNYTKNHVSHEIHNQKPAIQKQNKTIKVKKNNLNETVALPPPRKATTIEITFTDRVFPTPSRESRSEEEQEWLKKNYDARRCAGFNSEDLSPEEQNPIWLKEKGDTFFKQKNYLAAISAYSHGIKLSNKMVSLYINRSAAHWALGNLHKTIDDCSTALELLVPPVEANLKSRMRCYARRGAALCKLGLPSKGVCEFEAALKLEPNNEPLKKDLESAKKQAVDDSNSD